MRTVWKFPLQMRGWNTITAEKASPVVLVDIDPADGGPAVWIEHDPEGDQVERQFGVFPTGGTIADDGVHVGSVVDRTFVWHVYERRG